MLKNSYWDVLHSVKKRRAKRDTYLLLSKKMGSFMEILPIQHYRFSRRIYIIARWWRYKTKQNFENWNTSVMARGEKELGLNDSVF